MSNEKSGRTGKFCVAAGCTSTHKDNLSLHEFPKENVRPNIRRQWIKFVQVKRKDFIKPTANSVLCEKHFPPGSYPVEYELKKAMNLPVRKKCLLPDAVPTIHTVPCSTTTMPPSAYGQENFVYTSPVAFSTPAPASQLPPPKKMRTAFRKRECARNRITLASLHYNENTMRDQAVTKDGQKRYDVVFPKFKKGGYTVRGIKTRCTYGYVGKLIEATVTIATECRMNFDEVPQLQPAPPPLCSSFEKPNKADAIKLKTSRYMNNNLFQEDHSLKEK